MSKKGNLIVLCGIPGSGKSTAAKKFKKIISSDAIRKELFGDESLQYDYASALACLKQKNIDPEKLSSAELEKQLRHIGNAQVFSLLHARIQKALKNGEDVVYDATNLKAKERRKILKKFKGMYGKAICIFMDVPLSQALKQNAKRTRKVDEEVICRMHAQLEKPSLNEGFDEIIINP